MCSLSDGRDIAGEDRSSEGDQASSGSRGQFVVAAKTYEVPQQRQYISPQVEPFAGPNGPRVNFDDLRVQQEMNARSSCCTVPKTSSNGSFPRGFLPSPLRCAHYPPHSGSLAPSWQTRMKRFGRVLPIEGPRCLTLGSLPLPRALSAGRRARPEEGPSGLLSEWLERSMI